MAKLRPSSIDQDLALAQGYVPGYSVVRKFGLNPAVGTSPEDIWDAGGTYNFLQAAAPVRVRAGGDVADDAAGTGARQITVVGLDANWDAASETITTAGASASAPTTMEFIRVFRAYASEVGAYGGVNAANVLIETTGGTLVAQVSAERGQTLMAITSVPAKHTLWLTRFRAVVADTNKTANVALYRRERADDVIAPFGSRRIVAEFDNLVSGNAPPIEYRSYTGIPEKSDLWARANTGSGGGSGAASISIDFDYILTRNPTP